MIPTPMPIQCSRLAKWWLWGWHGLAAGVTLLLPFPWWGLLGLIAGSLYWRLLRDPYWFTQLQALADGRVLLTWASGEQDEATIVAGGLVTPWLIVLPLHCEQGKRLRLLLWPDSAPAEILRQWRVWLRWCWPQLQAALAEKH